MIYFDYNASAPLRKSVMCAMQEHFDLTGNASSVHKFGRDIRKVIEKSRQHIASILNVQNNRIIFTSGATESNNLAIRGFKGTVITSCIEHSSVLKARADLLLCPVLPSGIINLTKLEELIKKHNHKPTLVSMMAANNETGIVQPIEEIVNIVKNNNVFFHTDATQALGRINDIVWGEIDIISFSSHKIGGPSGAGCLIINPKCVLESIIKGGGQEQSYRSGTENLLGIIGFSKAFKDSMNDNWNLVEKLRNHLEQNLLQFFPKLEIIGRTVKRLPNTSLMAMPNIKSETQVINFDLKGIAVSAGSACSSGKVKGSHVLSAMGLPEDVVNSSLRISLGPYNNVDEVENFTSCWLEISAIDSKTN